MTEHPIIPSHKLAKNILNAAPKRSENAVANHLRELHLVTAAYAAGWKQRDAMIYLTPNDLSHLSEEEFNALAPQGHHALGPEPLSPAAQAVWDAYENAECDPYLINPRRAELAAALRAFGVEVILPKYQFADWEMANVIMQELQTIAEELDGVTSGGD